MLLLVLTLALMAEPTPLHAPKPASPLAAAPVQPLAGNRLPGPGRLDLCASEVTKLGSGAPATFQKLGVLPDANMEVAVDRVSRATGCPASVVVRYGVSR